VAFCAAFFGFAWLSLGAYTYYFSAASYSAPNFIVNLMSAGEANSHNPTWPLDTAKYAISQVAVPDGTSEYEVRATVGGEACSGPGWSGEMYKDVLLRASNNLYWNEVDYDYPRYGTGYIVRFVGCLSGMQSGATLSVRKLVNGTETILATQAVPSQPAGTYMRASIRSGGTYPGIFVRLGATTELYVPDTSITTGQPGAGGFSNITNWQGQRWSADVPPTDYGALDRTAPTAVPSGQITTARFLDYVRMSWPAVSDDSNGVGVLRYDLYQNGSYVASTKSTTHTFLGLSPNTQYTLGVVAVDGHLNTSAATNVSVTTPSLGMSSTVDGRRVGVHKFASGWGAVGENIDTRSGNVNFSMPIAEPAMRGAGGVPFALSYNSQNWRNDNGSVARLGADIGYGWGWRLQAGSLTPVWQNANTFLYWLFTDATGAEYRLDVYSAGKWTSKDGIYVTFEAGADKLWFNDGSVWIMGCESASTEQDAGTRYPTRIMSSNGNYVNLQYAKGIGRTDFDTSARLLQVSTTNGSVSFNYNTDSIPHLVSTSGGIVAANLTYDGPTGLVDPFLGGSYGTVRRLTSVTAISTSLTTSFTYNSSAEMTKVTLPFGGELQWDHATFAYVNNTQIRETNSRRLLKQAGASPVSYNLTRQASDSAQPMHTRLTLTDAGSGAVKDWYFASTADYKRGFVTQFDERGSAGGTVLRRTEYTYTQDATLKPYVQSTLVTMDVGLGSQVSAKTDQTLDTNGNVTQSRSYAFGNTTTPIKTVNCTYVTSFPAGTYLRNRVSGCSVTNGSQTLSLGSVSYDTYVGDFAMAATTGASFHDSAYGTTYTTRGNPVYVYRPGGADVGIKYNDLGEPVKVWTAGRTVNYTYNADFMVPTKITPANDVNKETTLSYNAFYQPLASSTPNGAWSNTTYGSGGRITGRTNADGNSVTISYNDAARQVTETVGQRWVRSTADGLGRPVKVETGDGSGTKTIVDTEYEPCACSPVGKLKRQSLPYAPGGSVLWTTHNYDGLGRTVSVQQPAGSGSSTIAYVGNKVTATDPAGRWSTSTYNSLGEVTQVTEPNPAGGANFETYYTYSLLGKLTQVSMPRPTGTGTVTQNRTFTFDTTWGVRLLSETHPESGTVTYSYLSNGDLQYRQDAKGQRAYFNYDGFGRVTSLTRTDAGLVNQPCEAVTYGYDANQQEQGRLSTLTWGDATNCAKGLHVEAYDYTAMGRPTKKQITVTQGSTSGVLAVQWAYDTEGKLTQVTYPATVDTGGNAVPGTIYGYNYDTMGRPTGETYQTNGAGPVLPLVDSVVYNSIGQLTQMRFLRNGQMHTENRGYNSLLQMTSLTVKDAANVFVLNQEYRFSATANDGKLTSSKNNITGEEVNYAYDALGRLASATTVGPQWGLSWMFDGFGNRLQQNVTKGTAPPSSLLIDPTNNRVQSWTYDANGNATNIPSTGALTYDVADRVKTGGGETYHYAPDNKRIWKNNTFTLWAGSRIGTYTLSATGFVKVSSDEYFGGKRLQVLDRLGSNREGGKEYFPYGEERTATGNPADKFATYHRDATGLDYADQRYYVSAAGRFATSDPARAEANHFGYSSGDPINGSDPSGLITIFVTGTGETTPDWARVGSPLFNQVMQDFGETDITCMAPFDWTTTLQSTIMGGPMKDAAPGLGRLISELEKQCPGQPVNLVGYSHGGNVIKAYSQLESATQILNVVTMGTPNRWDFEINRDKVDNYCTISFDNDLVQFSGAHPAQSAALSGAEIWRDRMYDAAFWLALFGDWRGYWWNYSFYRVFDELAAFLYWTTRIDLNADANIILESPFNPREAHSHVRSVGAWVSASRLFDKRGNITGWDPDWTCKR